MDGSGILECSNQKFVKLELNVLFLNTVFPLISAGPQISVTL